MYSVATKHEHRTTVGRFPTEGAAHLRAVLAERGLTQAGAEDLLGSPRGQLNHWIHGDRVPGARWAAKLEETFGIPARGWGVTIPARQLQKAG